jgi:hypothetical protein
MMLHARRLAICWSLGHPDAFNWMKLREIMHQTEFDQQIE